MNVPDMQTLLEAGAHFGHQTRRWNPNMKPFIFMKRNGIHIIDIAKTIECMKEAGEAIASAVKSGQKMLFVCTKRQGKAIVREEAERCGMPFVTERWLGGTLTNLRTIRQSVRRLEDIEKMSEDGTYDLLAKKETLLLEREKGKLLKVLDGIRHMERLPGLVFIIDTRKERIALNEANKLGLGVVGICDTNADPDRCDYPIPGNDDALRSIRLFASFAADAVLGARAAELEGKEATPGEEQASTEQAGAAA
ncbi:MAG: 30S ribosomal protein S2 [Candidatus Eisenbacteria bacterium]|nr:30S ribosomal protein S2 [Candidatus Eisenbacteria bacterium]